MTLIFPIRTPVTGLVLFMTKPTLYWARPSAARVRHPTLAGAWVNIRRRGIDFPYNHGRNGCGRRKGSYVYAWVANP